MNSRKQRSQNHSMKSRKKFKIVEKKTTSSQSFRLFDFQVFDTTPEDPKIVPREFRIRIFGINEDGETCSILVTNFCPFFYVKIPDNWDSCNVDEWYRRVKDKCKYSARDCLSCIMERRSQLYDFTANKDFLFAKCVFRNMGALYAFRQTMSQNNDLKKPVYESKIPPLLRYFHIHSISPSGWIEINSTCCNEKQTTCKYEYVCTKECITPLPEKETPVPYKICSVDIEASSSHGDFPVPVKDYKRAATQFVDILQQRICIFDDSAVNSWLKKAVLSLFGFGKIENIDLVYPKWEVKKDDIQLLIKTLLTKTLEQQVEESSQQNVLKISQMFEDLAEKSKQESSTEETSSNFIVQELASTNKKEKTVPEQQKQYTIANVLRNTEITREEKIFTLNTVLTLLLPPLEGDRVTFIGTTFLTYGQKEPYKNHCIVVGSCDNVPNAEIVTVEDEKECLLEWTELIQDENPDIIIGYNIFGFYYQFMFQRSKELYIHTEFCKLSRIEGEVCCKRDKDTKEMVLDHTQNRLASGDYDLHYFGITGRLQIDLLFYFRRDYNMSSYKLDDVAGTIIRDDIKGIETRSDGNSNLYSKNLSGLHEGDFIHLEITNFTTDYYMNGKKFRVLCIEKDIDIENHSEIANGKYNVITIEGDHPSLDPKKQTLKWGMAKDDVSPQDIFRMSKE